MEQGRFGCIQESWKGVLKCFGLESGGGDDSVRFEEQVPPPQPPTPPTATYDEPQPSVDDQSSAADPLVEVLTSSIDNTVVSTRDIDNNSGGDSNYSTIDDIMNTSGGTTSEPRYVELIDTGKPNMSLLNTRLISSGGGGKNH